MIKRFILVATAAAATTLGLAMPVHADYPPGGSTVTTKPSGDDVVVGADVCPAGQGLEITFTITPPGGGAPIVLKDNADELGHAEVTYTPTVVGTYGVEISIPGDACTGSTTEFGSQANLPQTGSDSNQWVVTATALVLTGAGFAAVAMRRRRHAAA